MPPKKILAVDDSRLMLKMYEVLLRDIPVVYASDGAEALAKLTENPDIEVMLLDVNMPRMGGLEVLEHLRAMGATPELRVIVVSTEGHEQDIARALERGASAYVTKPFDRDKLLAVVDPAGQGGA